jgi:hypothetical protein
LPYLAMVDMPDRAGIELLSMRMLLVRRLESQAN